MVAIAGMIARVIKEGEACIEEVKAQVIALCAQFELYGNTLRD